MEGESNLKKEWQAPEVVDLDVNNTEGGKGVYHIVEAETYAGPS